MKHLLTILLTIFTLSCSSAQFLVEEFDEFPAGWLTYSEYIFDYVTHNDDKMDLFKQSDADEPLMLATPVWNLGRIKKMEVDILAINLSFISTTVPELHIGYLEKEGDFDTFINIHSYAVTNTTYEQVDIYLGAYQGEKNLVFRMTGDNGHIINLDNLILYEEPFQSDIPTAIHNLVITPDSNGSNTAQASWTNPSLEADGDPLQELLNTDFYNAGTKIFSIASPVIGNSTTTTIEVPKPGFYKFDVSCSNSAGQGYSTSSEKIWIGLDVPGPVADITIEKNGNEATLTWQAPEVGASGVFFDMVVDSYTVERSDGKVFIIPGNESIFKDLLDIQGSISYTITPENSSGLGTTRASDIIYHLEDDFLYYEDFYVDVVESPSEIIDYEYKWTNSSTSPSFWNFYSSTSAGGDPGEMAFLWSGSSSGNDLTRVISPVINTEGLPAVAIEFRHYVEFPASPNFYMVLETTSDGGQTWNEIERWQETSTLIQQVSKTVGNDDVGSENFQFAISVQGNTSTANYARYDNMRVYYQPSIDAVAIEIEAPERVEPTTIVPISGVIENGSTEIIAGTVTCVLKERFGQDIIETYSQEFIDLDIGEKRTIDFGNWEGVEGEYVLDLTIATADDQQPANDELSKNLDVLKLVPKDNILIEKFTGTWCSFCPGAALGVKDLIAESQPVVSVSYHRNDDYETATTQDKMDLYNILGFPTVVFDGGLKVAAGDFSNSIVSLYRPIVEELKTIRVPMSLVFYGSEVKGSFYEAWIDVTAPSLIQNPNHVLRVALIEDGIAEEWQSQSVLDLVQKTYFETSIDLSENGTARKFVKMELPDDMDITEGYAVAWLQSTETKEVFNAELINLLDVRVDNKEVRDEQLGFFPNPSTGIIYLSKLKSNTKLSCYDSQGRLVHTENVTDNGALDLSLLEAGCYYLEFDNQEERTIVKFIKL